MLTAKQLNVGAMTSGLFMGQQGIGGSVIIYANGENSEFAGWIRSTQVAFTNATAMTANELCFSPVLIYSPFTISNAFVLNGSTVAGTTHVGVYDIHWNLITSANAVMSGASVLQTFAMSGTISYPGNYFLAIGSTSSTAIIQRTGANGSITDSLGMRAQTSAISGGSLINPATPGAFGELQRIFGIAGSVI